jgi:hypothetical protein
MLKKIISASTIAAALIFTGCGSDSNGDDRLAAQHAIDKGDSGAAIALLEPTSISDLNDTQREAFLATLSDTDKMTLASAYMQEADVSIMDIVSKMDTEGDASFASFANNIIGDDVNTTAYKVKSIDTAIAYYESMAKQPVALAPSFKATALENVTLEGAKLYLGLAYLSKVTMLFSFFGDVDTLEEGKSVDEGFRATSEAIKCIYTDDCAGIIKTSNINLNFTDTDGGVGSRLDIAVNGTLYSRFTTDSGSDLGSLLIADYKGYFDAHGSTKNSWMVSDFPFGTSYKFEDELLEALNSAFDLIIDKAPENIKEDVREYKREFDKYDALGNRVNGGNGEIDMPDIRAYIVKEN